MNVYSLLEEVKHIYHSVGLEVANGLEISLDNPEFSVPLHRR